MGIINGQKYLYIYIYTQSFINICNIICVDCMSIYMHWEKGLVGKAAALDPIGLWLKPWLNYT